MAILPPPINWSKVALGKDEKIWSAMILFMILMMGGWTVAWVGFGNQNVPETYYSIESDTFEAHAKSMNVASEGVTNVNLTNGINALARTTAGAIYMVGRRFEWTLPSADYNSTADRPINGIQLKMGEIYELHVGSIDMLHGFELMDADFIIAIQIVPGYDYVIDFRPTSTGLFRIICNEYCGVLHHEMAAFMEVVA